MTPSDEDLPIAEQLKRLELRLLDPLIRKSASEVGDLLADDFREFAGTGQAFDKAQIIQLLQTGTAANASIADFKALVLAPDVALVTFRYSRESTHDRPAAESVRSSIWKKMDGRWQMVFHQGTLCGEK